MIVAPLCISLNRKKSADKRISLGLNWYRNAFHRENNEAKKAFLKAVTPQIEALDKLVWPVMIVYTIYPMRRSDIGNWGSVVDKFFSDALVDLGKLPDDDFRYITQIRHKFGGVSKSPRCEIEIFNNYQE
jgi:hypothetical protein